MYHEDGLADKMKLKWGKRLDWLEIVVARVRRWMREYKES